MHNLKTFLQQAMFALAMAFGSGAAMAGPIYHVDVDTSSLAGTGLMDFNFLANLGAAPATASLSNFSGAFGAEFDRSASVLGAIPTGVSLTNEDGGNYLTQAVTLGGMFGFDIVFSGDFVMMSGQDASLFSVSLYSDNFASYLGVDGAFAEFSLLPSIGGAPAEVLVSPANALANIAAVAEVPEPSELLLMLSGLAMMGLIIRRRTRQRD